MSTRNQADADGVVAAEAGKRVRAILAEAERDVAVTRAAGERDAAATMREARARADREREAALERLRAEAALRVEALTKLRGRAVELGAALGTDGPAGSLRAVSETLTRAVELIAREAGVEATAPARPRAPAAEPPAAAPASSSAPPPFGQWERRRLAAIRLEALRDAVAGASREDLAERLTPVLGETLAASMLDDVFGSPRRRADGASRELQSA